MTHSLGRKGEAKDRRKGRSDFIEATDGSTIVDFTRETSIVRVASKLTRILPEIDSPDAFTDVAQ